MNFKFLHLANPYRGTAHLSKCLDVHVGLSTKYKENFDFKFRVRKLAALAFIPVADLITTYEALADTFEDDELQLLVYFESTWIGAVVAGRRGRRSPPLFPHEIWNVVGRHHTGSSCTTNSLEAFHHAFNSLLTCQHPSIWILLKSLQREQALTNTLACITRGDIKEPSALQRQRNTKIRR